MQVKSEDEGAIALGRCWPGEKRTGAVAQNVSGQWMGLSCAAATYAHTSSTPWLQLRVGAWEVGGGRREVEVERASSRVSCTVRDAVKG